jgi:hypothetical protein
LKRARCLHLHCRRLSCDVRGWRRRSYPLRRSLSGRTAYPLDSNCCSICTWYPTRVTASANACSCRTVPGPYTFNSRPRPSAMRVSQRTVFGSQLNIRTTARSTLTIDATSLPIPCSASTVREERD